MHDRRKHARRFERHAAAIMHLAAVEKMVEPQHAHAERVPAPKLRRRHVPVGDHDAAQPLRMHLQRGLGSRGAGQAGTLRLSVERNREDVVC
jgi:hypothetical protein